MQKLRRLNLSDNDIQDIPDELGSLMSLEELDISKNGNILHLLKITRPSQQLMFKANNRNTRTSCEICHWRRSGVFIVNFEHI